MGISKLWIQLDSKVLVEMLKGIRSLCPQHKFILQQCKDLIAWEDWEIRVTHCFREANQVADRLANLGITASLGTTSFHVLPLEVRDVFLSLIHI